MMLTVHGLPFKTKFQDVKALIKQECNIPDFILDNLVDDGYDSKKVRIGLTNDEDGYRLMKCLEGFRMSGSHVLRIAPVSQPQSAFEQRSNYSNQPRNDYPNQKPSYSNQNDYSRPNTINPTSNVSPHVRNIGDTRHNDRGVIDSRPSITHARNMGDTRHNDRGAIDSRPSLTHVRNMGDTRHNDRGAIDSRPSLTQVTNHPQDSRDHYESNRRDQDSRSDFRDHNRGPLVPPTLRPASLNARIHGIDSRNISSDGNMRGPERPGIRSQDGVRGAEVPGMRGSDRQGMRAPEGSMRPDVGLRGDPSYQKPDHRQVSNSDMNRQPHWTAGDNDHWSDAGRTMQSQSTGFNYPQAQGNVGFVQQPTAPQGSFPNRGPQPQTYQQQLKPALAPERPLASSRSHVLRSVEIVDAPIQPRAQASYPQMQKPITIMKDNFQGPTQYNITGVPPIAPFQGQGASQPWGQQHAPQSKPYDKPYDDRHLDKPLPKAQDYDKRRFSPTRARPGSPGRRSPPRNIQNRPQPFSDRRVSPRPFRSSPNRHAQSRFSPTRRDMSPKLSPRRNSPRKMSPRRNSPGRRSPRRISPFTRKISPRRISPPKDTGRRISPFGRKLSPSGPRRISPFARKVSPSGQRRISPFARKASPPGQRRISPFGRKISPGRRVSPKRDELRRTSPSMMKYDYYVEGDRRMGARESPSRRYSPNRSPPRGSGRYSPTQINYGHGDKDVKGMQNRPNYEAKQAQKYTGAGFRPNEAQYPAPARNDSTSPWQTEKIIYPSKDQARPNPLEEARKKLSPRRSRSRSPGKDRFRRHSPSPRSPRRSWALEKRRSPEILPPPPPLWPGQEEDKPKHPVWERNVVPERFDDKQRNEDKYRNEDKFNTRAPRFSPRRDTTQYTDKLGDYGESQYRKSPRDEKKLFPDVDKDFNEIYQRAVEFRRKTEELRKSNEHRTRYDDENQRRDKSPLQDKNKPTWIPVNSQNKVTEKDRNQIRLDTVVKEKRDKASEEIAMQILEPHNFSSEQRLRVMDELKFSVFNIMLDMFQDKDVSYIELVIKFRARYNPEDEEKILMDVLASMPSHYKNSLKRKGDGLTEVPAKMSRPTPAYSNPVAPRAKLADAVNKYSSQGGARLKHDSRKRTRDERDDRDLKKGSPWSRKTIGTERPRALHRGHRISTPTFKERKVNAPALNEYEEAYDNQPKQHLEEPKTYDPPKIYESKPIAYVENKHKIVDHQPTFFEHKPKEPRIQENNPKVQAVKAQHKEEAKPEEKSVSVAERTRPMRFNELSPLMTSMVEDELKNIMIKIWQTLPDDAPKGAEKLVLDKLKNEAGDDLRNTIGLNVTKRLLNVNNNPSQKGLLVKIQMHSTVSYQEISDFCKKYRIGNLKYIQQRMYAGRLPSWTDLDELYSIKNLRCGKSKMTITPIYNFLKCPPMLRTVFDGKQDYASKEFEKEAAKKINKPEGKAVITADKVLAENAKKVKAKKESTAKEKATDKKVDSKTEPKKSDIKESPKVVASKAEDKKPSASKPPTTNVQKETNTKPTIAAASKPVISSNVKKDINPDSKVESPKTPKPASITTAKKDVALKAEETKTNPIKVEPKTPVISKPAIQTTVKKEMGKGDENNQASKTVAKTTTTLTTAVKEPAKTANKEPVKPIAEKPAKPVATKPISNETKPIASKPTATAKKETVTPNPPEKITVSKTAPIIPKTAVKTPPKTTKVDTEAVNNEDDFDELDDHDILALLSGGIVLDECSGSDED